MQFVAFSDTHNYHNRLSLPDGDVLLFAGDMCGWGHLKEVEDFGRWLSKQPHPFKIVIAGNHDWPFQLEPSKAREALGEVIYLEDEAVEIQGVTIYGSPWQPKFCRWAFNLPRGEKLREIWSKIPSHTDILLTHGPPYGTLDRTFDQRPVGCEDLRARVKQLPNLKAHIFGHIHESYGTQNADGCQFYNASICDLGQRKAVNKPWTFSL